MSPVVPLGVAVAVFGYEVYALYRQQQKCQLHFATFYDFSYSPVPHKITSEDPLNGTYYPGKR